MLKFYNFLNESCFYFVKNVSVKYRGILKDKPLVRCVLNEDGFVPQKSSCTVADRSFSVGTLGEILQSLVSVSGGRACAGKLSNRLLPVLVAGVRDSDNEVRNNSVFGLGALAQAAGPLVAQYPSQLCVCVCFSMWVYVIVFEHC